MPTINHKSNGPGERRTRNAAIRALQPIDEVLLYAVRTKDGHIKIGMSTNLVQRLWCLEGGVEEILALKPGTKAEEAAIHKSLDGHAAKGREYYYPTPSVLAVVNSWRIALGMDPVVPTRRWAS